MISKTFAYRCYRFVGCSSLFPYRIFRCFPSPELVIWEHRINATWVSSQTRVVQHFRLVILIYFSTRCALLHCSFSLLSIQDRREFLFVIRDFLHNFLSYSRFLLTLPLFIRNSIHIFPVLTMSGRQGGKLKPLKTAKKEAKVCRFFYNVFLASLGFKFRSECLVKSVWVTVCAEPRKSTLTSILYLNLNAPLWNDQTNVRKVTCKFLCAVVQCVAGENEPIFKGF